MSVSVRPSRIKLVGGQKHRFLGEDAKGFYHHVDYGADRVYRFTDDGEIAHSFPLVSDDPVGEARAYANMVDDRHGWEGDRQ